MHESMKRLHEVAKTDRKSDIAFDLNVGASTVTNWSKRGVSKEGALAAAEKYGTTASYILYGSDPSRKPTLSELKNNINQILSRDRDVSDVPADTVKVNMANLGDVPIISWVAAGSWSSVEPVTLDDAVGYAPRPDYLSPQGFCLVVRGRSMLPDFKPNDVIYVEPQADVWSLKDGDLVVVSCNDDTEATFKQLVIGETSDDMYLKPLNPDWHEQKMTPMGECRLVGKVVGTFRKL